MRIATWNVNSVRQRLEHLLFWLDDSKPDVVCLQELKCLDEAFPRFEVEAAGYNVALKGQKTWNGVAILSRLPMQVERLTLPGDASDEQARYIEAVVSAPGHSVRVASIYLPNGNPVTTDKYAYKLGWMDRLIAHAGDLLALEEPVVLAGDFNVIPAPRDASDPSGWVNDALFLPATRLRFEALLNLGYTEALRHCSDAGGLYTFWDYQAGAWQRNAGIRIDHALLSPLAADRLAACRIDKDMRARDKPSDHVPLVLDLA